MLSVSYDLLAVVERHLALFEEISLFALSELLRGLAYAAIDLVKGTRVAAVRSGVEAVAALARGLNVRASGAMIVQSEIRLVKGERLDCLQVQKKVRCCGR